MVTRRDECGKISDMHFPQSDVVDERGEHALSTVFVMMMVMGKRFTLVRYVCGGCVTGSGRLESRCGR